MERVRHAQRRPGLALPVLTLVGWLAFGPGALAAPLPPEGELVRGIYAHPGRAIDNRIWAGYGSGYEVDRDETHDGEASVRCTAASVTEAQGASQRVTFDQDEARALIVAGWAKLEGVSGPADYHCSVYLDLQLKNGESWPMKIAAFDPAKEGWQYSEETYEPPAPIASASVYAFLREREGTAWFDDIYVGQLLADGTRSENLLESPGFEEGADGDAGYREEFFSALEELGCNAFHLYRGVGWDTVMEADEPPPIEPEDPFLNFVEDAHERGLMVWLTVGVGLPVIDNLGDPDHPVWGCVNNRWGEAYTRAVAYMTQYGVDGIGVVPDEWNYNTHPVRGLAQHADPEVAAFYGAIGQWCDCDVCHAGFQEAYGEDYPDVRQAWKTGDRTWARFTEFRYSSTRDWIDRSVKAAKAINPGIITDTMICVLPVCSDNRLATGAAWDLLGATTGLDCLQTDPYILLHNYLGDSTHYYTTETALHLSEANWPRRSGVTLEACKLRDFEREKEPVEVYGSALSCWVHGASEFFWWHMNYVLGTSDFVDPEHPKAGVRSAYDVMQALEQYVADGEVPGEVLVCYSRRSEDTYDWLARADATERLGEGDAHSKRGFQAHRNVLYALLRRGIPFRMTFLEHPDPARLEQARVLLVPFPYALTEEETKLLRDQAAADKTVILMSEQSPVDEFGQVLDAPRLAEAVEAGDLTFLGRDFAMELLEAFPQKGVPDVKVMLPALDEGEAGRLEAMLDEALERKAGLLVEAPPEDVEVALLESPRATVVLAVNWETERTAEVTLQLPGPKRRESVEGRRVLPGGKVERVEARVQGGRLGLVLGPQEAVMVAFPKARE